MVSSEYIENYIKDSSNNKYSLNDILNNHESIEQEYMSIVTNEVIYD